MSNEKVLDILREAQERELLVTVMYMDQHYILENLGYSTLAGEIKEISIAEMKHHESFGERILFLGGKLSRKMAQGGVFEEESIEKMLELDIAMEKGAIKLYNDAVKLCSAEGDDGTRATFSDILRQEEGHLADFELRLEHLKKFGDQYLVNKCL